MKVISFSGVDGSGKSTQLELLREQLISQGKKVAYFHAVEFSLANRITRLLQGKKLFRPGQHKAITHASWFSLLVRQKFLLIDMLRFRCFLHKLRKDGYDYLLSDRSFYDVFINLEYLALQNRPRFLLWNFRMNLIERMLPRLDMAFYFDIPAESVMSRQKVPEQGIEYVRIKISLFKNKIAAWQMIVIDASQTQEMVSTQISNNINNYT